MCNHTFCTAVSFCHSSCALYTISWAQKYWWYSNSIFMYSRLFFTKESLSGSNMFLMPAAALFFWVLELSQRVMEKRWSLLASWTLNPRIFSIAFDQEEKPTFVNAGSLFDVDLLKFLHAKQNALSLSMLYSSHGKLSYQTARKQRFFLSLG